MKVTITVSCSRTSRVARAQKGLTCPILSEYHHINIAMNGTILTPTWNRAKQKVRGINRCH